LPPSSSSRVVEVPVDRVVTQEVVKYVDKFIDREVIRTVQQPNVRRHCSHVHAKLISLAKQSFVSDVRRRRRRRRGGGEEEEEEEEEVVVVEVAVVEVVVMMWRRRRRRRKGLFVTSAPTVQIGRMCSLTIECVLLL